MPHVTNGATIYITSHSHVLLVPFVFVTSLNFHAHAPIVQEAAVSASQAQVNGKQQQLQHELMTVRLALARNLAQAHITTH